MTNANGAGVPAQATGVRRPSLRFVAAFACAAGLLGGTGAGQQGKIRPRVALWIECEGRLHSLDNAARVRAAIDSAAALGATDVFLQVYRNGRAWFPTRLADDAPYERARAEGFDPITLAIDRAHRRGIRVHAWVNVLRVEGGKKLLTALGPEALLHDGAEPGTRFRPDTPGVWLDPTSPAVAARIGGILVDLAQAYPALDGVHLDYVRYPVAVPMKNARSPAGEADLGWSESAAAQFRKNTGRDPHRDRAGWDAFRRDHLTNFVRSLRQRLRMANPRLELSAAVMPEPNRARHGALQDWPAWARGGILDLVVPMNYAKDAVVFARLARACSVRRGPAAMLMGIGAWRLDGAPAIAARVRLAMDAPVDGVALFSHDNLRAPPRLVKRLGELLRSDDVLPPITRSGPPAPGTSVAPRRRPRRRRRTSA